MSALTLEDLKTLAATKPPLQAHPVPVYEFGAGKIVFIAELGANESEERIAIPWAAFREKTGQDNHVGFRAFVAAACWCSDQSRTFVAKTAEDITAAADLLGKQDRKAVNRMYDLAAKLNGLTDEDTDEKNLPPAGDGNGTSPSTPDSPAPASGKNA